MTPEEELTAAEVEAQDRYPVGTRVTFADPNVLVPLAAEEGTVVVAEGMVNGAPLAVHERDATGATVVAVYVPVNVRRPGMSDAGIYVHASNIVEATPPGGRQ